MKPGDINLWWLARVFKHLPFPENFTRRLAYLRTRDVILKVMGLLAGLLGTRMP